MRTLAVSVAALLVLVVVSPAFAQPFADVPTDHWAFDAIAELAAKGIIEGFPDGTFKGDRGVTRYEVAMIVARIKPDIPNFAVIPATMTTKAPVGPPIWTFEPPSAEIRKPAITAVYIPICGETPDAIPNAMASGRATSPTVKPAIRSATKSRAE